MFEKRLKSAFDQVVRLEWIASLPSIRISLGCLNNDRGVEIKAEAIFQLDRNGQPNPFILRNSRHYSHWHISCLGSELPRRDFGRRNRFFLKMERRCIKVKEEEMSYSILRRTLLRNFGISIIISACVAIGVSGMTMAQHTGGTYFPMDRATAADCGIVSIRPRCGSSIATIWWPRVMGII